MKSSAFKSKKKFALKWTSGSKNLAGGICLALTCFGTIKNRRQHCATGEVQI